MTVRVRSGVEGLDRLIDGGFPAGASIVLQGPSGTEKDAFAIQFLAEGLRAGEAAIVVVSSATPDAFLTSLGRAGVDVQGAIAANRLKVVDWHSYQEETVAGVEERGHILRCSVDLMNVGIALGRALGGIAADVPRRAVLEVLSRALRIYDVDQVYAFAQGSKAKLARAKATSLFLVEKEMHDPETLSSVSQPFDGVIDIERRREGDTIIRKIGVLSLKDTVPDSRFHFLDLDPAKGLAVQTSRPTSRNSPPDPASSRASAGSPADPGPTTPAAQTANRATMLLRIAEERIRHDGRDADAWFAKASALAAMGQLREAIGALDDLVGVSETYPGLWVLRAKLLARVGDTDAARESRRRAESLALKEDQDTRAEDTIACPMCDTTIPVDAAECPNCRTRFVEEVGLAEELENLGKAAIQDRIREELKVEPDAEKAFERKVVVQPRDRVVRPKGSSRDATQARTGRTNGLREGKLGRAGRTNGLTNGLRGRTNGLTNGLRGRTNGLTNGLRGRTNGLTNGLRGRTNGLTNGLVNGLASLRRGMTNGLTNGSGFTNGLGSSRFRREATFAKWKLYVIPVVAVALLLLPLLSPSMTNVVPYPITIDGSASDWDAAALAPQAPDAGLNPNVDILRFGVADNVAYLAFMVETNGSALRGGDAPPRMDTIRFFLDVDRSPATGYRVDGIGADRMIAISGWGGAVNVTTFYEWGLGLGSDDWAGWRQARGAIEAAVSSSRIEAQIEWGAILFQTEPVYVTVHARDYRGAEDVAEFALNSAGASLSVIQDSVAPDIIGGTTVQLLRLELSAFGADARVNGVTATLTGSARFDTVPRVILVDSVGAPVDQRVPVDRRVSFQFGERTIPRGTTERFFVAADVPATSGETLGAFIAGSNDISALDAPVTLRRVPSARDVGYVGLVFATPRVDGGFAEWTSVISDGVRDVYGPQRPDIDLTRFAAQASGNVSYFFTQVGGQLMAGTWVPETNGLAPAQQATFDQDRDSVPDSLDPYPFDFNNDGIPDAQTNGDYDGTEGTDYGFPGGTDRWLNTTIPLSFPPPYAGRFVSVYIGPSNRPSPSPDDILRVFVDLDNRSLSGFAIGGLGADRMIELSGASGRVRSSGLFTFVGNYPGDWAWSRIANVSFALGHDRTEFMVAGNFVSSGSKLYVEIGEALGAYDPLGQGTRGTSPSGSSSPSSSFNPTSSFLASSSPTGRRVSSSSGPPGTRDTLIDGNSNAISTLYNHQRKVVRAGDVAGDTACDATNSDGCWYAVFYDQFTETSNTQASTETITTGSKVGGTFPTDIQTENGVYIQYREAGFLSKVGAFNIGTGAVGTTVPVTGVGFQPKAVVFWTSGRTTSTDSAGTADHQRAFGVAVSTTDRRAVCAQSQDNAASAATSAAHRADEAICSLTTASAIDGLADLSSMDTDGFTMIIDDVFATNLRIHYLALGGSSLTNAATGMFTESAAVGNQDVTTVGFQPDAVFLFSAMNTVDPPNINTNMGSTMVGFAAGAGNPNDIVWAGASDDGAATMQTISYHRAGESIALFDNVATLTTGRAEVDAWLSNGFSLNWNERASTRRVHYLALKGGSYLVGDLLTLTTAGTIAESGFGFSPKAALFLSHNNAQTTADTPQANDELSIGAFSSTTDRGAQCVIDEDNQATSDVGTAVEHDEVYCNLSTATAIEGLMGVQSVDSDGFTVVMDDPDPIASFVGYIAIGGNDLLVRYDWTGVPAGESYTLQVKGYRGDENVNVQVLTPPSTWTTRITISATTNTMHTYALVASEYNAGAPSVRFVDVTGDGTASDLWLDYANVVSNNAWDRIIIMRSSDTSGSTWGSQIILASGRTGDSALLLARDSTEPSIAIDAGGFLHVVWAASNTAGDQSVLDRIRYTKTIVAYPTQAELAASGNWEAVTNVDDAFAGFMPTVSTDTSNRPHIAWSSSRTVGTVYYKNKAASASIAVDSTTTSGIAGAASSITVSHTTGSGSNRLMLVGITITNDGQPIAGPRRVINSVTFGGTGLTEVATVFIDDDARVSIYRLIAPAASTTANVVATLDGAVASGITMGVMTFSGVDQTTPLGAPVTESEGDGIITVIAANDEWIFDTVSLEGGALTVGADQTQRWNQASGVVVGGASTQPGTADDIMSWTHGASSHRAHAGVAIKPAAGAAWGATVSWGAAYTGLSVDVSPQNNYVSLARHYGSTTAASAEAEIGYRSNTGTNTVNSPKTRTWDGSAWSGETEESTSGSPIRTVRIAWSPIDANTRIVVTLSDDGSLDAYVCTPTCTVTNNIGQVWTTAPTDDSKRFDIAYESTTGTAMLVYSVVSTDTTRDLAYRTHAGSWSAEQYIDDTVEATDIQYQSVRLASDPGSNRIGLVAETASLNDVNAWIWSGSAWGNYVEITADAASGSDREPFAIAWESNSGHLIAAARDSLSNDVLSREYTTSWSAVSSIRCGPGGGEFLSLKANPVGDDMIMVNYDNGASFGTCYWTGSAWANGQIQDATTDTGNNRVADFAWEDSGSKGLLVWGTTAGQITYRTFTAPNTWGTITNVAMGANMHPWVQLRTNPVPSAGGVKIMGAVMEGTVNDLGAITWDGTAFTVVGASTFSADVGVTTFESFELEFWVPNEIQYLVCKTLASSSCDASSEFTKFDGAAGYNVVASAVEPGTYPSLATTYEVNGDLWVAYPKKVDGTTRAIHARFLDYPAAGWAAAETVDSLAGTIFTRPSIGIDKDNNVHALYVATSGPQVYYNRRVGGAWETRTPVQHASSDNPTIMVRAPNDLTYGTVAGGLYWKASTSETYFYIPEFETIIAPVLAILIGAWGWRRRVRCRVRSGFVDPH